MIQFWENFVTYGRTNGNKDRQTDKSDFIGPCPTNVERPQVDAQLEEGQRENEDCPDALNCKSLVPTMKALSLKKKRLAKIKISQLLLDLEFDEWQCLTAF